MIFVLTPRTVANAEILKTRTVPRRLLTIGRLAWPRPRFGKLWWRTFFERSLPRYMIALAPFPIAILMKPEWALAISQAPLPMFAVVLIIETYVLSVGSREARRALIEPAKEAEAFDLMAIRAREALTGLAVRQNIMTGTLYLMVEVSEMLRVPHLTYVSVQTDGPPAGFLDLDEEERTRLAAHLFAPGLDEDTFQRANIAANSAMRVYELDVTTISAHARLAAMTA